MKINLDILSKYSTTYITFNEHRSRYETVCEYLGNFSDDLNPHDIARFDGVDTLIEYQVYERTPICSIKWYAIDLEDLVVQIHRDGYSYLLEEGEHED